MRWEETRQFDSLAFRAVVGAVGGSLYEFVRWVEAEDEVWNLAGLEYVTVNEDGEPVQ